MLHLDPGKIQLYENIAALRQEKNRVGPEHSYAVEQGSRQAFIAKASPTCEGRGCRQHRKAEQGDGKRKRANHDYDLCTAFVSTWGPVLLGTLAVRLRPPFAQREGRPEGKGAERVCTVDLRQYELRYVHRVHHVP